MAKYAPSDDGKVVEGKIVVYLRSGQAAGPPPDAAAPRSSAAAAATARAELAGLQAAALIAAAEKGVPFCAECEQARRELAKRGGSPE
ncbi:MAG: hypothetical protein ACXWLR_05610 [Myxococcales bacterium]